MGRDGITGLIVLAASAALFAATSGLERNPLVPIGPAFYPRLVLGITAALAVALVAWDVVQHRHGAARAPRPAAPARYGLVAAAFAVFAAYVVAMPWLGFRIATVLFVAVMQAVLERPRGARGWAVLAAVSIATSAAAYFAFESYLQVLLPRGRWTGW